MAQSYGREDNRDDRDSDLIESVKHCQDFGFDSMKWVQRLLNEDLIYISYNSLNKISLASVLRIH